MDFLGFQSHRLELRQHKTLHFSKMLESFDAGRSQLDHHTLFSTQTTLALTLLLECALKHALVVEIVSIVVLTQACLLRCACSFCKRLVCSFYSLSTMKKNWGAP
jgi:hypothetical protein